jgi:hypothetical protein
MVKNTNKTKANQKPNQKPKATKNTELEKDLRIIPIDEWDWDRLIYSEPQVSDIPDGSGKYRRIWINYKYDEKSVGPAIISLEKKYSYGVQPDNIDKDGKIRKDQQGNEISLHGYRVPIVMTNQGKDRPNPTKTEQAEIDILDGWVSELKRYAIENKKAIGKGAKSDPIIEGMISDNILYRKKDDEGMIMDPSKSPTLYTNLKYFTKSKTVGTDFYGPGDKKIDALSMTSHFHIYPNIQFTSIFIGAKSISLQHHLYDATVEPVARAPQKRLARKNEVKEGEEGDEEVKGVSKTEMESEDDDDDDEE